MVLFITRNKRKNRGCKPRVIGFPRVGYGEKLLFIYVWRKGGEVNELRVTKRKLKNRHEKYDNFGGMRSALLHEPFLDPTPRRSVFRPLLILQGNERYPVLKCLAWKWQVPLGEL